MVRVSVIIPTYKRADSLMRTLRSLQDQSCDDFETIVVDNAASDDVRDKISAFNENCKHHITYIPEPRLGVHNARHTGAKNAQGNLLIFTDDDATFSPGWIASYEKAFDEHKEMAASGGPIFPEWDKEPPGWLLEYIRGDKAFGILSFLNLSDYFKLDNRGIFYSVNMAIRRDTLFLVGGFNPEIFGDRWLGNGETGLQKKMWARNLLIGYTPGAIVYHHIPEARMTEAYFVNRWYNQGASIEYEYLNRDTQSIRRYVIRLARICISIAMIIPWTMKRMLNGDKFAVLKLKMDIAFNKARVEYVLRLFNDGNLRELVARKDWINS